jgi:hypothetical protein
VGKLSDLGRKYFRCGAPSGEMVIHDESDVCELPKLLSEFSAHIRELRSTLHRGFLESVMLGEGTVGKKELRYARSSFVESSYGLCESDDRCSYTGEVYPFWDLKNSSRMVYLCAGCIDKFSEELWNG